MELVFAAIAAGGLVGASNQYACLLVLSVAARLGIVELAGPMQFMGSFWFMGLVAVLWVITACLSAVLWERRAPTSVVLGGD